MKMGQIPQKLLNDHFTNAIIQKVIKTKFVNNYRAYVKMKNLMIKTQHNSRTCVKMWQIPQKLLNDHFTNIIQKVIKTIYVNNYRAHVKMKNKMIKVQHNGLFTLTKE